MNQMNMNGANMPNGVAANMVGMSSAANGAAPRAQAESDEYKAKLNTYIYEYFLKNDQYDCARSLLNSELKVRTKPLGAKKRDADAMDTDSKDDIEFKKPNDLPLPDGILESNTDNSFLLDWFTLFWEIFLAPRGNKPPKLNPSAVQYTNHIREQSRARQEAQNNFLRQPMGPNMQQQYMMRMGQMPAQMGGDLRSRLGARAPLTQQQQQQLMHNQMLRQQQMERAGSDVDMNGQRPRTPSSAMIPGMEGMSDFYGNAQMRQGVPPNPNGTGNHALQDYQMQLMLLEQQNKKRLLMARQEQDNLRPDQQAGMGGQQFQAPGMSPQGSRSGPSPNPSDQMKRGTPKMGQAGLPGSPMPDGTMNRASPGAMNFNNSNMPVEMMAAMSGKMEGMPMGPNGGPMRPPSSHPQGFNGAMAQQMAQMRAQQNGQMPNGGNWQGPQGQTMMNPQAQQLQQQQQQQQQGQQGQQPGQQPQGQQAQGQMGTPQQRNAAMPPPQNVPAAGGAVNGRPASPAQSAASTTPQQTNKANPKKKEAKEPRKRPNKKASTAAAAATPSAEADASAPTPTPQTPITPMNKGFNEQGKNAQQQPQQQQLPQQPNAPALSNASAPNQPVGQPQPDTNMMTQFDGMDGTIDQDVSMDFGSLDTGDVLTTFDFDAFLQDDGGAQDFDINAFGNYDGLEAGGDAS